MAVSMHPSGLYLLLAFGERVSAAPQDPVTGLLFSLVWLLFKGCEETPLLQIWIVKCSVPCLAC